MIKPSKNKKLMLISPQVVCVDGWIVKASMSSAGSICLIMMHVDTKESHTRFFTSEFAANQFISSIVEQE